MYSRVRWKHKANHSKCIQFEAKYTKMYKYIIQGNLSLDVPHQQTFVCQRAAKNIVIFWDLN